MGANRKPCAAEGCVKTARRNGPRSAYCEGHTYRFKRYGSATMGVENTHECRPSNNESPSRCKRCGRLLSVIPPFTRFMSFVRATESCWLWEGPTIHDGYGKFEIGRNKHWRAHRFTYSVLVGPIPTGLALDHLCRVRNCVNPDHLEPVTNAENIRRGIAAREKQ